MYGHFRLSARRVLLCLPLTMAMLSGAAFARCYGPATFQTCENGDGDSLVTIREGHDSWATGYDADTKEVYQRFTTRYGKTAYSDSINFHGDVATERTENYTADQYHVEGQKYDRQPYSFLCSVRLGCF